MGIRPKLIPGFWINHGEIGVAYGRLPIVIGNCVFVDDSAGVDGASLAAGEDDVTAVIRVCGQQKNKIGLLFVWNNLKTPPLFQLSEGGLAYGVGTGAIVKVDCRGGLNNRGLRHLFLGVDRQGSGYSKQEENEKEADKSSQARTSQRTGESLHLALAGIQ